MNHLNKEDILIAESFITPQPIIYESNLPIFIKNHAEESACIKLFELARTDPIRALNIMYLIASNCDDALKLDILVSGPLEELLKLNSDNKKLSDHLVSYARENKEFLHMLHDAWEPNATSYLSVQLSTLG